MRTSIARLRRLPQLSNIVASWQRLAPRLPPSKKYKEETMNELINQIAQKTGIGEDKARQAAETAITFLKQRLPGSVSSHLDSFLQGGGAEGMKDKLGSVFNKAS
jgi:hypothetical protein